MLPEKKKKKEKKGKKSNHYAPQMKKMDTSEKCRGIVIFHILIHITRKRKETHAVYQIGFGAFCPGPCGTQ